jgi:hypothetical protein
VDTRHGRTFGLDIMTAFSQPVGELFADALIVLDHKYGCHGVAHVTGRNYAHRSGLSKQWWRFIPALGQ